MWGQLHCVAAVMVAYDVIAKTAVAVETVAAGVTGMDMLKSISMLMLMTEELA